MSPPPWMLVAGALAGLYLFLGSLVLLREWRRKRPELARPPPLTQVSVSLPPVIRVEVVTEMRPPPPAPQPPEEIEFPGRRKFDPDKTTQTLIKRPKDEDPAKTISVTPGDAHARALRAEQERRGGRK